MNNTQLKIPGKYMNYNHSNMNFFTTWTLNIVTETLDFTREH